MASIIPSGKTRDDHPTLRDIYEYLVPYYAVQWRDLGLALGVESYQLYIIEANHASCEVCCRMMVKKWLQTDPSATWGKLVDAIEVISHATSKLGGLDAPTLKELNFHVLPRVAPHWLDLGVELLLNIEQLDIIRANYRGDVDTCCTEMFRCWLRKDPNASWNKLLKALRSPSVGQYVLADEIEQKFLIASGNTTPLLKDLYERITPQYAKDWKVIGTLLGLPIEELKIIEHDNHHKAFSCCNAMLERWLEMDPSASRNKLLSVIQSPGISSSQNPEKGSTLLLKSHSILPSVDQSTFITYKESCPFNECDFVSNVFGYNGGTLCIPEHAVTITIPHGAIEKELEVEVEAAASLYGPYLIPEGYSSISAFVWLGASYQFKEKVRIDVEHHAIACQEGILDLCLLTASADDIVYDEKNGQQLFKMHQDDCHYDYTLNGSTCSFFVQHFCSKCLASRRRLSTKNRMAIYHYLPKDYKSEAEFIAEVCFCYDLKCCRKTVEKQMKERRMSFQGSEITQISDKDNDEIRLLYPEELDGWSICHLWKDKITSKAIDFRELYKSHRELKDAESRNEFPPRFKLKLICYKPFITLNLKYKLCIKRKKESEELTLNIFVEGRKSVQQAALHSTIHQPHPTEEDGRNDVDVARTTSQINNLILVQGSTLSLTSPSILPSVDHSTFNSLQNFADDIYNTINIDLILPMMISNHLVSPGDAEYLSTTHLTTHEKQQKLGNIVLRLSEDCVKLFLECLSNTKHYEPHKMLLEKIHSVSNKPTSDDDIDSDYH